jgi:formate hydrogenlyase subunit 3/multisubunit Na+/H+ antiporter MnhD subunit
MNAAVLSAAVSLAAIAFPLVLALAISIPGLRSWALRVAPLAALPALGVAVGVPQPSTIELPSLLLRAEFYGPDAPTRGFLLLTAVLWLAAGWFARAYLEADSRAHRFWLFFLISMASNVGLVLARDVVSFYTLFTLMTLAAYGVIVHEQSREARYAAHVYFVLAFAGELVLLTALYFIVGNDTSMTLEGARRAVADSPHRDVLGMLLFVGFGIKAGVVPLHVWLPLAHPVAPTPASAVLSGAMIKAGLLGWLRFFPLGIASLAEVGGLCAGLGFVAAVFAALVGATQRRAKTVLAYSSISQMGIMTMVVGMLIASPQTAQESLPAVVFFAIHHAFAKGALFLGTSVAHVASQRRAVGLVTLGLAVSALSIAGAPFSSGALAKVGLYAAVERAAEPWHLLGTLLSVAAIGSTLIMVRFVVCAAPRASSDQAAPRPGLWMPWLALVTCDLLIVFVAPVEAAPLADLVKANKVWSATWPVLAGGALAAAAWYGRSHGLRPVAIPAGDLLVPAQALGGRLWRQGVAAGQRVRALVRPRSADPIGTLLLRGSDRIMHTLERAQRALGRYEVIGSLLAVLLLTMIATLTALSARK